MYALTSLLLWLLSAIVWKADVPGLLYKTGAEDKLSWLSGNPLVYGIAFGLMAGLLFQPLAVKFNPRLMATVKRQMKKLDFFLPFTPTERIWFGVVSVSAGVCEETLYRGFLYHFFRNITQWDVIAALAASAIVFGLAHGYQGIVGICVTGVLGAALTLIYLGTGSLLVPMIIHAALDLRILLFPKPDDDLERLPQPAV
ncbi:MAG TPA: CPBP family intramembrane glutamic endopeptidase [Silvibacterium sp.]|nr:CPBP family intramembrane glutamic endopeptidase [Silvibacterium sp.]